MANGRGIRSNMRIATNQTEPLIAINAEITQPVRQNRSAEWGPAEFLRPAKPAYFFWTDHGVRTVTRSTFSVWRQRLFERYRRAAVSLIS